MKKSTRIGMILMVTLLAVQTAFGAEPVNYYNSALGKSDNSLMTALSSIIRTHREVSYTSGLLDAFKNADTDDQGYIIDIYSNCRYKPSDNGSSASTVGEGYNREHSFPRSWFGGAVSPMNTSDKSSASSPQLSVSLTPVSSGSAVRQRPSRMSRNGVRMDSSARRTAMS